MIKTLLKYYFRVPKNYTLLELPRYGQICLSVNRGYKVFDLDRKAVIKLFGPEATTGTIMNEIENARNAALLDIAPAITRWNINERWYEEEYVSGYRDNFMMERGRTAFLKLYYEDIAPIIQRMIVAWTPLTIRLGDYVKTLRWSAKNGLGIYEKGTFSASGLDRRKVLSIRNYLDSLIECLNHEEKRQIYLVFSHGDFSLANILRGRKKLFVIDWETTGGRSILCDLYNFFFSELYLERVDINVVFEINEAVSYLRSCFILKEPELALTILHSEEIYRRLYYLERVCTLLKMEPSANKLKTILRSIEVFGWYETIVPPDCSDVSRTSDTPSPIIVY